MCPVGPDLRTKPTSMSRFLSCCSTGNVFSFSLQKYVYLEVLRVPGECFQLHDNVIPKPPEIRYEEGKVISVVDKPDLSWHGAQLKYIGFQWLFILLVCLSGAGRIVPVRNIRNSSKVGISPALSSFLILSFINCWTTPKVIHSFDSIVYSLLSLSWNRDKYFLEM